MPSLMYGATSQTIQNSKLYVSVYPFKHAFAKQPFTLYETKTKTELCYSFLAQQRAPFVTLRFWFKKSKNNKATFKFVHMLKIAPEIKVSALSVHCSFVWLTWPDFQIYHPSPTELEARELLAFSIFESQDTASVVVQNRTFPCSISQVFIYAK